MCYNRHCVSIVDADELVLQHQVISSHKADQYLISRSFQLTHWPLGNVPVIFRVFFPNSLYKIVVQSLQKTSQMMSQHWLWFGAVRQQAIIWANVDPDLCHHMTSLRHNELINLTYLEFQHANIFGQMKSHIEIIFNPNNLACNRLILAFISTSNPVWTPPWTLTPCGPPPH